MTYERRIKKEYFEWLYDYVCKGRTHQNISYDKLFNFLHSIEFTFFVGNDINRAKDGTSLRYRFAMIYDDDRILDILDGPCSVLEMIVALANRCEETLMSDTRYGDRTGQWFWTMLANLGINLMTDDIFDENLVAEKISIFLERRYSPEGKGGLFYIKGCEDDLRDVEIWTQLCWYLEKID